MKLKEDRVKQFFAYINERHAIRCRRDAGQPWPWTEDTILQTYKFCEVFRELDKVTKWIHTNWRLPYKDHRNLWFAMAVARHINWPETLGAIGFPHVWRPEKVLRIMKLRRSTRQKVYTGAYMIPSAGYFDKCEYTVNAVLDPLYRDPPPIYQARSLYEAFRMFRNKHGFGGFMAYEVVTDLRHTRYLCNATDIMTWANAGPGAKRGNYRLLDMPVRRKEREKELNDSVHLELMQKLCIISPAYLGEHVPALEMRDIEHNLCEWDKYERVRLGQGRPRSRYKPPVNNL